MLKKIIEKFNYKKKYEEMKAVNEMLLAKSTPELVIEKIMKRGIEWYDYNEIKDTNQQRNYYNDIQAVIKNHSFLNEINHLLSDQIEYLARESTDHQDTMNIRMTINAIDLIKERMESIYDPDNPKASVDNLYNAI